MDSTFHPADCRGRLQTIRQFRRSTQACFPLFIHSGINYPPAAGWSPFLSRKELRFASFPFLSFGILAFYKNAIRRIRLQIGFANLLLQPLTSNLLPFFYAPSRESVQDSCRPVKPCGFTPTQKWRRHFCRQQTKFADFILSLQRRKLAACSTFVQL